MANNARKTLFVRNLPYNITNDKFESHFSDYGPIKSCFIVKDRDSGKCRGFGYVKFAMKEDAETALKSVKSLDGRKVFVHFADKKPKTKKKKLVKAEIMDDDDDEDGEDDDRTVDADEKEKQEKPKVKSNKTTDKVKEVQSPKAVTDPKDLQARARRRAYCTVIVKNFVTEEFETDVRPVLMSQKNHRQITYPVPGRHDDTATILFKSKRDALKATKRLDKLKVNDKKLSAQLLPLEQAQKKEETQKLKNTRLIIRNLSFKITDEKLRESFQKFGDISDVHIPKKPDGKMFGYGFVQFTTMESADKALRAMNTKPILNRPVAVDWALSKKKFEELAKGDSNNDGDDPDSGSYSSSGAEEDEDEGSQSSEDNVSATSEEEEAMSVTSEEDNEEVTDEEDAGSDSDEADSDDGEESDEDEESDEGFSDEEGNVKSKKRKNAATRKSDTDEGKTLFIRNLSYDTEEEDLLEFFEQYGDVNYARIVVDPETEHSRGTAFVQYKTKEEAEAVLKSSEEVTSHLVLDGRKLSLALAMSRETVDKLSKQRKTKEAKDSRNLSLAREGLIRPGTQAAEGMSSIDLSKRQKLEAGKRQKLRNPNYFISMTRLSVHNIPVSVDDKRLRQIFTNAAGEKSAKVTECRIMRDLARVNAKGEAKSRGYGFVAFSQHSHALEALRQTNNNPEVFGDKRRLIVEFSLENRQALAAKEKRLERVKAKQESIQKGKNFVEVKTKKKNKDGQRQSMGQKSLSEVAATKEGVNKKGPKGLPSHWGPKLRHKKRENNVKPANKPKDKRTRREARQHKADRKQDGGATKVQKNKKRGNKRDVSDNTDTLINRYKERFTTAYAKGKAAHGTKSKWFDS